MKSSLYTLAILFSFIATSAAMADSCSDALDEFKQTADSITSKRLVSSNDVKIYQEALERLETLTMIEPCYKATLEATGPIGETLKAKRIETLDKYFKLKIYEEGGTDLMSEYADLTGKVAPAKKSTPAKISNNSSANKSCSDVINQNEAVNLDNARNQDGVGWCYAYTAADLLSFRLKQKISAVSLYNSGRSIEADITDIKGKGGDIGEAIETYLTKKNGLCLESDLPSSDFKFCAYRDYNNFLNSLYQSITDRSLENTQCLSQNLNSAFPGVDYAIVKNYADRYGTKNLAEFLFDYKCKKKSFKNYKIKPINKILPYAKLDEVMTKIDSLLTSGEVVGVAYDYSAMNEKADKTSGHASLVVGRRQNSESGECEYLVRNSWGKDCTQNEGPGLTCHKNCDANGECRYSGHFWVSQARLKKSMLGITYLP